LIHIVDEDSLQAGVGYINLCHGLQVVDVLSATATKVVIARPAIALVPKILTIKWNS
jgi:hypothetical protein